MSHDEALKQSMAGEFKTRLTEIDDTRKALSESKTCPSVCAGHASLVDAVVAQSRGLATLLRVERDRIMADGLTMAACDSIGGRGYTVVGRAAIIIASGLAIGIVILALFYGATRAPLPIYSSAFAGEKPTHKDTP
jgi:hypothetical protein